MNAPQGKIPVTIAIPVKDEERNLPRCLARLSRFAHVVVIDSGSTDQTLSIAAAHGAEIVQFAWDGRYPKKRNWYLQNARIETEWILFLDADELIGEEFCDALEAALRDTPNDGFWLNYTNHFLGTPIRHGIPQRKLALFRVGKAMYERIDEDGWSGLDMEIHEHPVVEGPVGEIAAPIDHDDDRGIAKFLDRHRHYAQWEARRFHALQAGGGTADHFSARQRRKYASLSKWWFAWAYFAMTYIFRLGFLDGRAGFYLAFYKLWYFVSIRLLIREEQARIKQTGA